MHNATCARTETSKLPTYVALLYGPLFYGYIVVRLGCAGKVPVLLCETCGAGCSKAGKLAVTLGET